MKALPIGRPMLALAPMQAVTGEAFFRVMGACGGPDLYVTEYFRVHRDSRLEPAILRSITHCSEARPILAQLIGQDEEALVRTARELSALPEVVGIDLNLGCPAPVVCRKEAGGGLLREPERVRRLLGRLREELSGGIFTVKTRLGYDEPGEFARLLEVFSQSGLDLLTIHGRTVREGYRTPIHPEWIARAVQEMGCPVLANGNVVDGATAEALLEATGAAGLMIGRGAVRNPWLFSQLRARWAGVEVFEPTRCDLRWYLERLFAELEQAAGRDFDPLKMVQRIKKFAVFTLSGLPAEFGHDLRRAREPAELERLYERWLSSEEPLPGRPPEDPRLFCGFEALLRKGG